MLITMKANKSTGIGYDMIIVRDLMLQPGILDEFKHQFIQWDGATVPIKEPSSLLGKTYLKG